MFSKKQSLLETISEIKSDAIQELEEVRQQYEVPMKTEVTIPKDIKGVDGDRKIVTEGDETYLYLKVGPRWMKTQLEEG